MLREAFSPQNCNPYYSSGRYLQHLFYPYKSDGKYEADGSKLEGEIIEAGGWDFYKPQTNEDRKFRIVLADGKTDVIMLRMWRKDGLQKLIELVTDPKNKYFKEGELTVQPDK